MAEKLKDYDFSGCGRTGLYPFNEWADGSIYRLRRGEDFTISAKGMSSGLGKWARKNGYLATIHVESDEAVVFQMLKESA